MRLSQIKTEAGKRLIEQFKHCGEVQNIIIAESGAGKTTSVFNLAAENFIIYIEANGKQMKTTAARDESYSALIKVIGTECHGKDIEEQMRLIEGIIQAELAARVCALLYFWRKFPSMTPLDFLPLQINGGQNTIKELSKRLREYNPSATSTIISAAMNRLRPLLKSIEQRRLIFEKKKKKKKK
eukprot:TRINITY_DN7136_c0_g1_i3.p1 TRINITY_DN7136_c0_g1~~TRINITY_DN7136_c0_g1_i3.p1  ORF type:complete len:184 (-),score=20.95 TRINITY_DN7136_c0_g1_i3:3-554(-)